jgi:hypothetical protein
MAGTDHGPELTLDRHDDYRTYNAQERIDQAKSAVEDWLKGVQEASLS